MRLAGGPHKQDTGFNKTGGVMASLELVSERPVFLDDLIHKMRVIRNFGRPGDDIQVEVDDIRDYPDSHHIGEVIYV
jgi:hypothetical protein